MKVEQNTQFVYQKPASAPKTFAETKGLPSAFQMTNEERMKELSEIKTIKFPDGNIPSAYELDEISPEDLEYERELIAKSDENSGKVDFHIGTFTQGDADCWLLTTIEGLSDKQVEKLIDTSDAPNSYKVTFKGFIRDGVLFNDRKMGPFSYTVTNDELNSNVTKLEYGSGKSIHFLLSSGDKDVKILEIAALQILNQNAEFKFHKTDNPKDTLAPIEYAYDLMHRNGSSCVQMSCKDEIEHTIGRPIAVSKETELCEGLKLNEHHGYTVKKQDENNVFLTNPFLNSSEIKVPKDKFLEAKVYYPTLNK